MGKARKIWIRDDLDKLLEKEDNKSRVVDAALREHYRRGGKL